MALSLTGRNFHERHLDTLSLLGLEFVCNRFLRPFSSPRDRYENIVIPRESEAEEHRGKTEDRKGEASDHHGVVAQSVELRESKAEDDDEDWAADVTEEYGHERRDAPVATCSDDHVEIPAKLIALWKGRRDLVSTRDKDTCFATSMALTE